MSRRLPIDVRASTRGTDERRFDAPEAERSGGGYAKDARVQHAWIHVSVHAHEGPVRASRDTNPSRRCRTEEIAECVLHESLQPWVAPRAGAVGCRGGVQGPREPPRTPAGESG